MDAINFNGQQYVSPEVQKRLESKENFSALNTEKLKQDTAEFAQKTTEEVKKENFVFRIMRSFGAKDPKKLLTSLGLTVATVAGVAFIGNMLAKPTSKLSVAVDNFLLKGDNPLSKGYRAVSDFLSTHKANFIERVKNSKSKTIRNIYETFTNRKLGPVNALAKTYPSGGRGIFAMTPPDILETGLKENSGLNAITQELDKFGKSHLSFFKGLGFSKNVIQTFFSQGEEKTLEMLKEAGVENPEKIIERLKSSGSFIDTTLSKIFNDETASSVKDKMFAQGGYDNMTISRQMINGLRGLDPNSPTFHEDFVKFVTQDFSTRPDLAPVTNVIMNQGGLTKAWWPVNIIDKAGSKVAKLLGKEWKGFCRGNLFNALMKFSAMDGKTAQTLPGKFAEKSVIFPAEYISNFVNDKSGYGVLLCASLMSMYNNVQDAPKDKKLPTVANDFASTIGGVAISTPIAAGIAYSIATLKNLDTNVFTFLPKMLGKVVGLGLKTYKDGGWQEASGLAKFAGGFLRFALILFVIMPKISKPVNKIINKIFGKPYNKAEEEQKAQLEQQQNAIIPELGITNKEFMEKIQANPKALEKLQNNPLLAQKIANEPKLLLDLLDGKDVQINRTELSPASKKFLERSRVKTNANLFSDSKNDTTTAPKVRDSATYIPSSQFVAESQIETNPEIEAMMNKADIALKNAEKLLS